MNFQSCMANSHLNSVTSRKLCNLQISLFLAVTEAVSYSNLCNFIVVHILFLVIYYLVASDSVTFAASAQQSARHSERGAQDTPKLFSLRQQISSHRAGIPFFLCTHLCWQLWSLTLVYTVFIPWKWSYLPYLTLQNAGRVQWNHIHMNTLKSREYCWKFVCP